MHRRPLITFAALAATTALPDLALGQLQLPGDLAILRVETVLRISASGDEIVIATVVAGTHGRFDAVVKFRKTRCSGPAR
jgi:hypothetical protein